MEPFNPFVALIETVIVGIQIQNICCIFRRDSLKVKIQIRKYINVYTTHSQMLGKFEYTGGLIFKVVLEC